jgi:hypothetical protein
LTFVIGELLEGKKVEMPREWATFKRAQEAQEAQPVQSRMDL